MAGAKTYCWQSPRVRSVPLSFLVSVADEIPLTATDSFPTLDM